MVEQSESSLPQGNQLSLFSRVHLSSTSSILSCRCHGALFSQLQQSFYSEDQLALQESTKKLVEEVAFLYFFLLNFSHPLGFISIFLSDFSSPRLSTRTPRSGRLIKYFLRTKSSRSSVRRVFLAYTGFDKPEAVANSAFISQG